MSSDERKQRSVVRGGHEFRLVQVKLESCMGHPDGDAQDRVDEPGLELRK